MEIDFSTGVIKGRTGLDESVHYEPVSGSRMHKHETQYYNTT